MGDTSHLEKGLWRNIYIMRVLTPDNLWKIGIMLVVNSNHQTATTTTTTTNVKQSSKTHRLVTSHQKPPFHQGANIGFKASKMMKHKTTSHKRPASGAKFCPSNCFFGLVETCHERRSYSETSRYVYMFVVLLICSAACRFFKLISFKLYFVVMLLRDKQQNQTLCQSSFGWPKKHHLPTTLVFWTWRPGVGDGGLPFLGKSDVMWGVALIKRIPLPRGTVENSRDIRVI